MSSVNDVEETIPGWRKNSEPASGGSIASRTYHARAGRCWGTLVSFGERRHYHQQFGIVYSKDRGRGVVSLHLYGVSVPYVYATANIPRSCPLLFRVHRDL